ncbi:MAG: M23 family metallopeptidase [Rhodoglobus sp.]|nr:M23 family metallopeptidase [Rhodoglobus sp.]
MLRRLVVLVVVALVQSGAGHPAAASAPLWSWPVDSPRAIMRGYVAPATPYSAGHRGIDIRAPSEVLRAPSDGIVHFAGFVVDRPVLSIRHGDGVISSFEPVVASLTAGDVVSRGDIVGTIMPGHCTGPCVHMGVRIHGQYVSPLNWLGGIPRSVLLPTQY